MQLGQPQALQNGEASPVDAVEREAEAEPEASVANCARYLTCFQAVSGHPRTR